MVIIPKYLKIIGVKRNMNYIYAQSLEGATYPTIYVNKSPPSECVRVIRIMCNFRFWTNKF